MHTDLFYDMDKHEKISQLIAIFYTVIRLELILSLS